MRAVEQHGREVPDGEEGELEVAGEALFSGYFGAPEETGRVLHDGWLATGDRVVRDPDGHFRFVGWQKQIIKTLGLVVDRAEVEAELLRVPGVVSVHLETRTRPWWGHVLHAKLTVVGPPPSRAELHAILKTRLSFYKLPQSLEVVAA